MAGLLSATIDTGSSFRLRRYRYSPTQVLPLPLDHHVVVQPVAQGHARYRGTPHKRKRLSDQDAALPRSSDRSVQAQKELVESFARTTLEHCEALGIIVSDGGASRPGPAMPRAIGRNGASTRTIFSQPRHANFGRTCRITPKLAGTWSSTSAMSSPI